ncbi:MAG: hypothetical protein WKF40_09975 [Thermoleophilaceae bacterium]
MGPLAVFGITSDGLNLAVNLVLLFLFVLYFALIWWTYSDARRRIEDPMIVACATAASLFPFMGTVVYLIVRPPEYLEDVRERELEIAAAEARLAGAEHHSLSLLQQRDREVVPALPELHAPAQGALHHLRQAARPPLEDLSLLRGRGRGPAPARRASAVPGERQPTAAEAATQASGEQPPRRAAQRPAREDGPGREPGAARRGRPPACPPGAAPRTEAPAPRSRPHAQPRAAPGPPRRPARAAPGAPRRPARAAPGPPRRRSPNRPAAGTPRRPSARPATAPVPDGLPRRQSVPR